MSMYENDLLDQLKNIERGFPIEYNEVRELRGYTEGRLRVLENLGRVRITRNGVELLPLSYAHTRMVPRPRERSNHSNNEGSQ